MQDRDQFNITAAWNSLDENYLVTWEQATDNPNSHGIAFTHVFAGEQGNGENELEHPPLWLFEPADAERTCDRPLAAFNSLTGKFLVVFDCRDFFPPGDHELTLQRIDGTGTGLQGARVTLTSIAGIEDADLLDYDLGFNRFNNTESRFIIALDAISQDSPVENLSLIPVKGAYDPASSDQLDGSSLPLVKGEDLTPNGTGNSTTGAYLLTVGQASAADGGNIFGYWLLPNGYHFPLILK